MPVSDSGRLRAQRNVLFVYGLAVSALAIWLSAQEAAAPSQPVFEMSFRDDYRVIFDGRVLATLNGNYRPEGPENFFCLIGRVEGHNIMVDDLVEEEVVMQSSEQIIYKNDPPCQVEDSVGSIHSHPVRYGCQPSYDDFFTFGEMKEPEPIINVVQCGVDKLYILKMPEKQEALELRSLRWSTT